MLDRDAKREFEDAEHLTTNIRIPDVCVRWDPPNAAGKVYVTLTGIRNHNTFEPSKFFTNNK